MHSLLFVNLLTVFLSCSYQKSIPISVVKSSDTLGDTVTELGRNIMIIYQDKKDNYWFGSWETGLYRYNPSAATKTFIHFTTKDGLPHQRINEIKEDKSGNLYFNTGDGISQFDGQHFTTLKEESLSDSEWKLDPDDLWFTSSRFSGFVYRYDGKKLYRLQMPETDRGGDFMSQHKSVSSAYAVYSIYKDSKGNVWFGTGAAGACRYNGKSFDWIEEEDVTEYHNGPANGVRSIIEDSQGYFWFNSMYRYVVYGHALKQRFYNREKSIGNLDGKPDSDFYEYMSIAKDNHQTLWIATYGNGVWHYNGQNTLYYPVQFKGEDITIFSIYKDNKGDLWLGTHENGAYKFNGKTFEKFAL